MKKLLKVLGIIFATLLVVIAGVIVYVAVQFAKLDFTDEFDVSEDYTGYYTESYDLARVAFRQSSEALSYTGIQMFSIGVLSPTDNDLSVDVTYVPAQSDSASLLILSSGVHGVEGYVGHGVQMMFMEEFLTPELLQNTGVLLIHAVNPYGFKYTRRVTENNVDMNRNSPSTPDLYQTINEGYPKVYDLVNPPGEANTSSLGNRLFFLKAINEIRKASMPVLRQAVLQGQYQFQEGLYFGGMKPEPQIDSLLPLISQICTPYEKILAIDLHTGYGERGRLHFFPNPLEGEQRNRMEQLFDGYNIDWGDSDDFYTVTGDFVGFVGAINPGKEYYPMLFEYGTLNSQTTMGSLKSIHVMILENQGQQHGFTSERDSLRIKSDIAEMYNPSSANWRNYVMEQTHEVFSRVLPVFSGQ